MADNYLISVVSPVYRAELIVEELVKRICTEVEKITPDFEIILVEDGSPDSSWERIEQVCLVNKRVKGIRLSRNYGQHYAITAGLQAAAGDYVVVMDCDLQDDPKYILEMYKKALDGNDIVYTVKLKREHGKLKNVTASVFYFIFNLLTDNSSTTATGQVGGFSMISRKVVDAFVSIQDYHRHYLMVLRILGFRSCYLEIEHSARFEGKSSYTFGKLIRHAIDGITSQTDKLLRISIVVGFIFFLLSSLIAIIMIVRYFTIGALPGYTSLLVVTVFSTGLILTSIGITGLYISKIFDQVKGRPLYLIDRKINF